MFWLLCQGGQGQSLWEHPGTPSREQPFLIIRRDVFQKGAEVPGEDEEVVGGEGQVLRGGVPGLPQGTVALAGAFPQDLSDQSSPWDLLWRKGGSHT